MSQITVSSTQIPSWQEPSATELRIFLNHGFVTSDGKVLQPGSPATGIAYLSVACTVVGSVLTIPTLLLDSTTDGRNYVASRYSAFFFDADGNRVAPYQPFSNFAVPPTFSAGTTCNWSDIAVYNTAGIPIYQDLSTFSRTEILQLLSNITAGTVMNPMNTLGDIISGGSGGAPVRVAGNTTTTRKWLLSLGTGSASTMPSFAALTSADITTALAFTPINKAGDTGIGALTTTQPLTLPGDPTLTNHAANKGYVDSVSGVQTFNGSTNPNPVIVNDTNVTITTAGANNTIGWSGTLSAARGGLGIGSYTIGDLPYASGTTAFSKLAGVATGNALISGGVATAPSWGKIGLTTHVSGILPGANGGTGNGFFAVSGPTTSLKTFALPDASANILTDNAVVTGAQGGTGVNNSGKTITLGGNLTLSGSFGTTITVTGTTSVTLPTSGTLVNSAVTTLSSLTSIGTIGTGVWQGTVIDAQYGGTGVNNAGKTITLAGNLVTSGANSLTLTTTGATNVTLPTSGTLVNSAVTTLSSLASIGTIATGTWNATPIGILYGGTGATTQTAAFNALAPTTTKGDIIVMDGSNDIRFAVGTNGQVLSANSGTASGLQWITPLSAAVTSIAGDTGGALTGPALSLLSGSTGTDFNIAGSGTTLTVNIPSASASNRGLITTGPQTIAGDKTHTGAIIVKAGGTAATSAPIYFQSSSKMTTPEAHAFEWDNTDLWMTSSGGTRRKLAYTDSNITGSAASISGNLTGDVTSVGMATTYTGIVPFAKGGTATAINTGAATTGMMMRYDSTLNAGTGGIGLSNDGATLTNLNASSIASGTLDNARLSGVELTANKNAANGYAGLSAGSKITASQITELLASGDLTDFSGTKSGSGTTAIGATIDGGTLTSGHILTWDGTKWVNSPAAAGTANALLDGTVHNDTVANAPSKGYLVIGNATPKWDALAVGSNGTFLKADSTQTKGAIWSTINISTDITGTLGVGNGGTGITGGTSGGIPYFSGASSLASSAVLTANTVVLGGGSGTAPFSSNIGAANQVLRIPGGGGTPAFGAIDLSASGAVGSSVLQPANGGFGTANTNGAYVLLPLHVGFDNGAITTGAGYTITDDTVYVFRFQLANNLVVNKIILAIAAVGAGTVAWGIYAGDGNTKLIDSGAVASAALTANTPKSVTLGASVTLNPGYYYMAWTTAGATNPTLQHVTGSIQNQLMLNSQTTQFGTAANAAVSSVLPSTLGAITGFTSTTVASNCPLIKLQN